MTLKNQKSTKRSEGAAGFDGKNSEFSVLGINKVIQLLLGSNVQETIINETLPYLTDELETGGILVGHWLNDSTVVVVAATGAGPNADHQRLTFAVDVDFANQRLAELRSDFPGVDYVGEWHKHPSSFPRPSNSDFQMAKELLLDPSYPNILINPIVVRTGNTININYYYVDKQASDFLKITPKLLNNEDIEQLLQNLPDLPPTDRKLLRTEESFPGWWVSPTGSRRLQQEITALTQNGYDLEISEQLDETSWRIRMIAKGGPQPREFEFQCYGNYPQTHPGFAAHVKNKIYRQGESKILSNWDSSCYLYQVCDEVREQHTANRIRLAIAILFISTIFIVLVTAGILLLQMDNSNRSYITQTAVSNLNNKVAADSARTVTFAKLATAQQADNNSKFATANSQITLAVQVQMTNSAIQATISSQSKLLTAGVNGQLSYLTTPVPTSTPQPSSESYTLTITKVDKTLYDQLAQRDGHITPFHLMLVASNSLIAGQNLKLRFPKNDVYMAFSPGNPRVLTTPFNESGLGCQQDKGCTITVVNSQDQVVSEPVQMPAYNPDDYYLFTIS